MGAKKYCLFYALENEPWEQRFLDYGDYVIGRSKDSDIMLPETKISRQHARLHVGEDGCWIMDLGSANGTQIEGKSLPANKNKPLASGQIFTIISFKLKVEFTEEEVTGSSKPTGKVITVDSEVATQIEGVAEPEQTRTRHDAPTSNKAAVQKQDEPATKIDRTPSVGDSKKAVRPPLQEMQTALDAQEEKPAQVLLRFRHKDGEWEQRFLEFGEYTLGRTPECDIILPEEGISRRHASLTIAEDGYYLMDLGSANGTQIDGNPLFPRRKEQIKAGQVITIHDYRLTLEAAKEGGGLAAYGPPKEGYLPVPKQADATKVDEIPGVEEMSTRIEAPSTVTPSLKLRLRKEKGEWEERTLEYGTYVLGRVPECDICLVDSGISRRHAQLEIGADGCFITDLGSANGTQVDGKTLTASQRSPLAYGKTITIFNFQLILEAPPGVTKYGATRTVTPESAATRAVAQAEVAPVALQYRLANGMIQTHSLREGEHIIGRGSDCQVKIDSKLISRHHARLTVRGSQMWIADLGSKNGVRRGGQLLAPNQNYPINPGENFQINEIAFQISGGKTTTGSFATMPDMAVSGAPVFGETNTMVWADAGAGKGMGMEVAVERRPLNLMGHERITVGRAPDNQIVLNHPMVSRYHAVIERMGTRSRILDLHSANGIFINGKPVDEQAWLQVGDTIKIGPYQIQFTGNELIPSTQESYTIDVIGLHKWVSKSVNLLQEISLNIGQNEFVALVGMSGAGKSTLMDAINGFRPATHGTVLVNGVDLYKNYAMFRDDIGNVPQKDIVHMELTAEQALDYAAQLRMPADTNGVERKAAVAETLEDLGMTFKKSVPISRLSGGQLKRVSIGVELLTKPRLFFLDEPTSGLDPGTEYEMMKLLRRLADQGRTIMIITHATKNVMFCDKAIILARGGNLGFYGPPEYALEYFNQFRTKREQLEKDMEFDDIYRILQDPERGKPEEWRDRYLNSKYAKYAQPQYQSGQVAQAAASGRRQRGRRIGAIRQFFILSSRYLKTMVQDKITLGLTLALAPVLGLMNFIWGRKLFDPVDGDSAKVMAMWFITAVIALLVGAMGSMREIVKEVDIYKRERAVGLKMLPYIMSKIWVGVALAIYQGFMVLLALLILVNPSVINISGYIALLITMILSIIAGYMLGLVISAVAPNQNSAQLILIAMLVPQFLFAGVLYPLNKIPLGEIISPFISTRWSFEGFVKSTHMGDPLAIDACWLMPKEQRTKLTEEDKTICLCMGPQLFKNCASIPGMLSKDFYTEDAQISLAQPEPIAPAEPQRIPSPTLLATPTYIATPVYPPTPTYMPTPTAAAYPQGNIKVPTVAEGESMAYDPTKEAVAYVYVANQIEWRMKSYESTREAQMREYQATREAQFDPYRLDMENQVEGYRHGVETQIAEHVERQKEGLETYEDQSYQQFEDYADEMQTYGDTLSVWERNRQGAIASAEAILGVIYDDYGRAFKGTLTGRWIAITLITLGEFILILIFQKRKDVI